MKQIQTFILMLFMVGCASTPRQQKHAVASSGAPAETVVQDDNVISALKQLLKQGTTMSVMVTFTSSYEGIPEGYKLKAYNCGADGETLIETEDFILLESFAKYPNFSVVDRSQLNTSIKEITLGLNGTTASELLPGKMCGATHMLVIEAKYMLRTAGPLMGKYRVKYFEVKKLLDIEKNILVAMDKYSITSLVELERVPEVREEQPSVETHELSELPPVIKVTPSEPVETIAIYGSSHRETEYQEPPPLPRTEPITIYQEPSPVQRAEFQDSSNLQRTERTVVNRTIPQKAVRYRYVQPARQIPEWQLAHMLRQSHPRMRSKDDRTVVNHFIENHPRFREKVIRKNP